MWKTHVFGPRGPTRPGKLSSLLSRIQSVWMLHHASGASSGCSSGVSASNVLTQALQNTLQKLNNQPTKKKMGIYIYICVKVKWTTNTLAATPKMNSPCPQGWLIYGSLSNGSSFQLARIPVLTTNEDEWGTLSQRRRSSQAMAFVTRSAPSPHLTYGARAYWKWPRGQTSNCIAPQVKVAMTHIELFTIHTPLSKMLTWAHEVRSVVLESTILLVCDVRCI